MPVSRRLVLLPKYYLPTSGGLQNATFRIATALEAGGWRVAVHHPAAPADRATPPGVSVPAHAHPFRGSRSAFWGRVPELVEGDLGDMTVLAVGMEYEAELDGQLAALLTLRDRGARTFLRVATTGDISSRVSEARAARLAGLDGVIVLNRAMVAETEVFPALAGRVHHIPVMVDTARYRPRPEIREVVLGRAGLDSRSPVVLSAGRRDARKRLDLVVRAMSGAHAQLWLVGDSDRETAADPLVDLARLLNVRVRIHPGVSETEMPDVLAAGDVFVTASGVEGMSNAVLEAASVGLPIAAFAIPGIVETAEACAGAGFHLADARSGHEGLGLAIRSALANRPVAGWRDAREVPLSAFSTEQVAGRWRSLLGGRR
jgi:glycosyltransferase involved in cell wall biosynthesis